MSVCAHGKSGDCWRCNVVTGNKTVVRDGSDSFDAWTWPTISQMRGSMYERGYEVGYKAGFKEGREWEQALEWAKGVSDEELLALAEDREALSARLGIVTDLGGSIPPRREGRCDDSHGSETGGSLPPSPLSSPPFLSPCPYCGTSENHDLQLPDNMEQRCVNCGGVVKGAV